uniref:V-type proton ATPase subunit C n=1 Tax=Timema tahoe TaxID=61484 RepID=A0A7R9IK74_9NEOP|nr:unnamed protein product [Timema tahoe]
MTEYWLISAPGDKTCQQTWETMNNVTNKQNSLSENYKFHIPDLKVGTLDQLVGLSDDLGKLDGFVESVTRKVAAYLGEVLEDQRDKLHENLLANNSESIDWFGYMLRGEGEWKTIQEKPLSKHLTDSNLNIPISSSPVFCESDALDQRFPTGGTREAVRGYKNQCQSRLGTAALDHTAIEASTRELNVAADPQTKYSCDIMLSGDLPSYITRFQWDLAKYPIKQSLRNIADIISKQVGQIDADLKTKSSAYNNLKGNLQNLEKKQTGSLLTRNLAELVKKEHFILDSEYLTTLLVIVPKLSFNDWNNNYEKLTDMIVPRSSVLVTQDSDFGLYTVTLFKKVVEEFKLHSREKRFVVRDFTYNEEELAAGKNEITKLVTDKKKQFITQSFKCDCPCHTAGSNSEDSPSPEQDEARMHLTYELYRSFV